MAPTSAAVSPPSTARRSCSCTSSKFGMETGQLLRMPRLVQQDFERGKIGVPLDQGGHSAEAPQCFGVEVPDGLRYRRAVVVDQDIQILGGVMAGEMDLADCCRWQRVEIGDRVEPEVCCADIDVVDVAEDAAAGSAGGFGQEFRFGDG